MHTIQISTNKREQVVDLTPLIQKYITNSGFDSGIITIYSPHTTGAITVNENADDDVKKDIHSFLKSTIPQDYGFSHMEGNSDSHIKGTLTGFSQTFIVEKGHLRLGTWQGIFFMEFDGPRTREVWLKFISG
ncbi:MAG: secondary thiamine-phosphate synthase enzyme YjbQ [Candidatus Zapsychrus exili]|nr:secondary thiamine-phosphate synthase enzyme YjbQ [Candidatus Zapsychrus exili]